MLHGRQRDRFYEAYDSQLRAFIPNADDPEEVLVYLSTQQDYRAVLQNVRSWTKSFPPNENRELCVDFANVSRAF
ncbi:MCR_0457 family protein [Moraxella lacunata]